ncbi:hypothetical protein ACN20G_17970 [Streptomyces sp. BI20]|uniref:SCO2583 family membrane protein n=1 Tax=Streptomyces sp. BI20 TaxID=3403460 RepID=UPI003C76C2FD
MAAAEPPDRPDGPAGGDDEFRALVFDEDFVRSARIQEYSAEERMGEHARAVHSRSRWSTASGAAEGTPSRHARTGLLLVMIITMAFATAVYLGLRRPYEPPRADRTDPLSGMVVPLAPTETVPGGTPAQLYEHSPAARYRVGAAGITLPAVVRTDHFTETQIVTALTVAKDYLVQSGLDPDVLDGSATRPVRALLDPDQLDQFEKSLREPVADGRHAATAWLVRFDPAVAVLADPRVRVSGELSYAEAGGDVLEVVADHSYVYAVRPAGAPGRRTGENAPSGAASLFTVRREIRFRFDREDLAARRAELFGAYVIAGPQSCAEDPAGAFRPLLAGAAPTTVGPAAGDPYDTGRDRRPGGLCGVLAAPGAPPAASASAPASASATDRPRATAPGGAVPEAAALVPDPTPLPRGTG